MTDTQVRQLHRSSVRERWYATVVRTQLINGACRTLLMHVAVCHMDETGRIGHLDKTAGRFRGVPHEQLADELGWGKRQRVSERYREAIDAGLLKRGAGGYNGTPALYDALIPAGEGTQRLGTLRPVKVPSGWEPSPGKGPGEQVPAGWEPSAQALAAEGSQPLGHIRARVTYESRQDQLTPLDSRVSQDESAESEERSCEVSGQPTHRPPPAGGPEAEVVRKPGTELGACARELAALHGGDPAAMERVLMRQRDRGRPVPWPVPVDDDLARRADALRRVQARIEERERPRQAQGGVRR